MADAKDQLLEIGRRRGREWARSVPRDELENIVKVLNAGKGDCAEAAKDALQLMLAALTLDPLAECRWTANAQNERLIKSGIKEGILAEHQTIARGCH